MKKAPVRVYGHRFSFPPEVLAAYVVVPEAEEKDIR